MKLPRVLIALSLCAISLALALSFVIRRHADPCERLARLTARTPFPEGAHIPGIAPMKFNI
jgi:hypothetical protein